MGNALESDPRKRIEDAISQWWRGGGTARRIVDVLEREDASEKESRFVGAKLAAAAQRLGVITESVVESELEMARAHGSAGTTPIDRGHDSARCVFDDKPCPECAMWDPVPLVHGELIVAPGVLYPDERDMTEDEHRAWMRRIGDAWMERRAEA